jgi:WD40 repeat protein/tRNA A-37 threonylcarbamoyl transferase component Bud32
MLDPGRMEQESDTPSNNSLPPSFGDYEILEEIARGGMGVVYKARQRSLNRIVALKMILAGRLAGDAELRRFRAEAETAARLQHPNIVAIHEVGEFEGQPFFSMDYIEGRSLAELAHNEPLPAKRAAAYLKTIAEAVHYAHSKGVLHRDLKPSNILIDQNDQSRITDFGLAKRLEVSSICAAHSPLSPLPSLLTITGQVLGSPNFMPPEQAAGDRRAIGPASDVYSLGAILYQLLTGRPPFLAETLTQTLRLVAEVDPVAPRWLNPAVPRDLETVCAKCLEKPAHRRYATARDLADELGRFLNDEPILARPAGRAERIWRWCRRHPGMAGMGALVGALLLIVSIGSIIYATHLRAANRLAKESLYEAYLGRARAERWSGRSGRRHTSLELLNKASQTRQSIELRNEAIACLALVDLHAIREIRMPPGRSICCDAAYERYAEFGGSGDIVIRRVNDDSELTRYKAPALSTQSVSFSPHGNYLLIYSHDKEHSLVQVQDLNTGQTILNRFDRHFQIWAFSADGLSLFLAWRGEPSKILVYGLLSGEVHELFNNPTPASDLSLDPTGNRLAVSYDETNVVQIRSTLTGELLKSLLHSGHVEALDWHPNGKVLATGCANGNIYLWDTVGGQPLNAISAHAKLVTSVRFSHDGTRLASSSWDNTFRLWNVLNGRQILVRDCIDQLPPFSPDGRYIGVPSPEGLALCALEGNLEWREFCLPGSPDAQIGTFAWSPDGRLLTTRFGGVGRFWDISTGNEKSLPAGGAAIWDLTFESSRSRIIAATSAGLLHWRMRWESTNNESALVFGPTEKCAFGENIHRVALAEKGNVLAGLVGGGMTGDPLELFEWPSGRLLSELHMDGGILNWALSPGGKMVVAWPFDPNRPRPVWAVHTGAILTNLPLLQIYGAAFTPDDRLLIAGSSAEYIAWDTRSWSQVWKTIRKNSGGSHARVAITRDGKMGALKLSSETILLFEPENGREIATLESPYSETISWIAFSPDGSTLAAATQTPNVHLWNLPALRKSLAQMRLDWKIPAREVH